MKSLSFGGSLLIWPWVGVVIEFDWSSSSKWKSAQVVPAFVQPVVIDSYIFAFTRKLMAGHHRLLVGITRHCHSNSEHWNLVLNLLAGALNQRYT